MLAIGCHLSVSSGFEGMGKTALEIGANTFQFFTRNPRGSRAKEIDTEDATRLSVLMKEHNFAPIVAHAPYTLNPCSDKEQTREFALQTMSDDIKRLSVTPCKYYNFHPGSHVGQGSDTGIELIAQMLNTVLTPDCNITVLLETMAGKGSEIGGRFEELRAIIDRVTYSDKIGVCLDTCHVFDAGYDIVNDLDGVLTKFDNIIGLDKLCACHINDSKFGLGSKSDRHEKIGQGAIGLDAMVRIITHESLIHLPFILETPNELDGYMEEIKILREKAEG